MLTWIAPVIVFGLVVFVHELGHFLAAKWFGVYAPRFSIGFGPSLAKWRRGETEYKIGILPLGGYVRMASKQDEESAFLEGGSELSTELPKDYDPNAMIPFGPNPIPENRWFESKPLYARLIIMLAGVTMNLLLGIVLNVGSAFTYDHEPTTRVSEVLQDRPAARAGIVAGDSVIAVNGVQITHWEQLLDLVGRSTGTPLQFHLLRGTSTVDLTVAPAADTVIDPITGEKTVLGKVGMVPAEDKARVPFSVAVHNGLDKTERMATLVFSSLRKIVTREVPVSDLGGPLAIAHSSVQAAEQGLEVLLYLMALISVNLAVFNLLPIPILDGGQIIVQVIESARGRPLTDRAREYVARAGLAFILLLFITVTFNDLKRMLGGLFGAGPS